MKGLDREALEDVAEYFRSLAEPTRLCLLNALREREYTVGDLAEIAESTPANVSKHLALLARAGLVGKRMQGTSAYYRVTDSDIYALCDLVCGSIARRLSEQAAARAKFRRAARSTRA